ncbi:transcriptional regulator with XRE-family HTH domain [Chryseobacterium sp. SORGH_AS 447]|uniref:XRE family transcriptional regulator n=1 Tax=Chryseobacterium sp. SORGH_AS_0447 TaxID=3041769 RepID=UPI00278A0CEB|nr:XRE family transcriptional regulator [Chryseobacterium sp. SORGH_AS_0447]MDQ1161844.1 transcriptional regulator with XRE-family HTH domain [Chryseobacterium sp. SORGH_AS_0447]
MLCIKQDALAFDLGEDWNQKKISLLEQKSVVEEALLQKISEVLNIPVEAFQNFDEEAAINLISCNFSDNAMFNNKVEIQNINPIEKWIEALEEIKRLNAELIKVKDEQIKMMEKLIQDK